jgi:phage recombination protein Bet
MAAKYDMEPAAFVNAIKATVIKGDCSNEQFAAFLMVAKEYDLNPLTKEIYAFPDRGGITPIVSIDGWMNLINSHPQFDGMEFTDTHGDDGKLASVECRMYRKDRARPVSVIEYMSECFRQTDPWKKWPNRMLRHKAAIQCARYAFGFSGIMEPDEYERMKDITPAASQPTVLDRLKSAQSATTLPQDEREGFDPDHVTRETSDALTGEILDTPDTGAETSPSSVPPVDDAGSAPASEDDGQTASEPSSSPIPEADLQKLRTYAKDLFVRAAKPETDAALMKAIENRWAGDIEKLSEEGKAAARSISLSMRAILKGEASFEAAVAFHAEGLGCEPEEIGGVNG